MFCKTNICPHDHILTVFVNIFHDFRAEKPQHCILFLLPLFCLEVVWCPRPSPGHTPAQIRVVEHVHRLRVRVIPHLERAIDNTRIRPEIRHIAYHNIYVGPLYTWGVRAFACVYEDTLSHMHVHMRVYLSTVRVMFLRMLQE